MNSGRELDGWDIYPENLNYVQACDIHGYNYTSYRQQLSGDSKRLFVAPEHGISVKVIEFGEPENPGSNCLYQSHLSECRADNMYSD